MLQALGIPKNKETFFLGSRLKNLHIMRHLFGFLLNGAFQTSFKKKLN